MESLSQKIVCLFLASTLFGCSEDDILTKCGQESNHIKIVEKGSTTNFSSNECELFNDGDDAFFVIQNELDFKKTVNCDQHLPEIDFEKYTLLIGQKKLTWCCATALKQEVTINCEEKKYTYTIKLDDPDGKYQALSTFYHWVVISKIPSDYQVNFQLE